MGKLFNPCLGACAGAAWSSHQLIDAGLSPWHGQMMSKAPHQPHTSLARVSPISRRASPLVTYRDISCPCQLHVDLMLQPTKQQRLGVRRRVPDPTYHGHGLCGTRRSPTMVRNFTRSAGTVGAASRNSCCARYIARALDCRRMHWPWKATVRRPSRYRGLTEHIS
jgi:hypothetical protein